MNHRLRHQAPNLAHRLKTGACSIAASLCFQTCVHGSFCTTQFPRTVEALAPPSCEFSRYVYGMLLVTVFDMLDSWRSFILWAGALAQFHTFRYVFDTLGRRLGAISYLFDISPYFWPAPWRGPIFVHMFFILWASALAPFHTFPYLSLLHL